MLFFRELAELAPPLNPHRVVADEPLDRAHQEANPPATTNDVPLGNQAVIPPTRDRLGGNIEATGKLLDREHLPTGLHARHFRGHIGIERLNAALSHVVRPSAFDVETCEIKIAGTHNPPPSQLISAGSS